MDCYADWVTIDAQLRFAKPSGVDDTGCYAKATQNTDKAWCLHGQASERVGDEVGRCPRCIRLVRPDLVDRTHEERHVAQTDQGPDREGTAVGAGQCRRHL